MTEPPPGPTLVPEPRIMLERVGPALRVPLPAGTRRSWQLGLALADRTVTSWPLRDAPPIEALASAGASAGTGTAKLPREFVGAEAFVLSIDAEGVVIGAQGEPGRFYALQALAQLAFCYQSEDGTAVLPTLLLIDWPVLRTRAAHICYHLVHPFMPYHALSYQAMLERVQQLAHYRINTLLLELESLFPYRGHARVANSLAFAREELAALAAACRRYHIEIVPMVQCLGHAYNVLRHPEYAHLRETVETTQQYCPSNAAARAFYLELVDDVLEVLGPVRAFHVGGDESRRLGQCPTCRGVVAAEGAGALYGRHVGAVCTSLLARGITPWVWSDMMEHHPAAQPLLPIETVTVYWRYDPFHSSRPETFQQFTGHGRRTIGAGGARFGRHNHTMFLFPQAMRGIATMTQLCVLYGCDGALVTDWTKAVSADLSLPCLVYGAVCAWGDGVNQDRFAARFGALHFGVAWDWPSAYRLLAQPVPYCEDVGSRLPDRLDRLDWSAGSFAQSILRHVCQENRAEAVAQLQMAVANGERAREILDTARVAGVDPEEPLWAHLDLACRTQLHWARMGLLVDTAARLLKFPAAGDGGLRAQTAQELEIHLTERDCLRAETAALLQQTTFPVVAERIADFKFEPAARTFLLDVVADLRAARQRSSLLDA